MPILFAVVLMILTAGILMVTRGPGLRATAPRLLGCSFVMGLAMAVTLIMSRRPSGAWRDDLIPDVPILFAVFLAEAWALDYGVERLFAGAPPTARLAAQLIGVQLVVVALGTFLLNFATMIVLVVVMPS